MISEKKRITPENKKNKIELKTWIIIGTIFALSIILGIVSKSIHLTINQLLNYNYLLKNYTSILKQIFLFTTILGIEYTLISSLMDQKIIFRLISILPGLVLLFTSNTLIFIDLSIALILSSLIVALFPTPLKIKHSYNSKMSAILFYNSTMISKINIFVVILFFIIAQTNNKDYIDPIFNSIDLNKINLINDNFVRNMLASTMSQQLGMKINASTIPEASVKMITKQIESSKGTLLKQTKEAIKEMPNYKLLINIIISGIVGFYVSILAILTRIMGFIFAFVIAPFSFSSFDNKENN